ncbi:MAG: hypothetical protein JO033_15670 [Acidobacteriaceae bacterium]|nr:hypothetical protein [Acidobacteriaceae bacterium]MBV9502888.1 hypothetical protein [Acidobacteriaceae bacterium]
MANYDETNALDPMVSPAGSVRNPREKVTVLSSSENVIECDRYEDLARSSGRALGSFARLVRDKPALSMIAAAAGGLLTGFALRRL